MKRIKSVLTWVIHYLIVPAGFMYAVGTIDFIKCMHRITERSELEEKNRFSKEELATLEINPTNYESYLDSVKTLTNKQIKREKINDMNTYFRSLKQFDMFLHVYQDSLDHDSKGKGRMILMSFNFKKQEIIDLNLGVTISTLPNDIQEKHWKDIEKYRAYWNPKEYAKQKATKPIPYTVILMAIVSWFICLYLRGMLFAAILFLFWRKRIRREVVIRLGIMSFISSVLIWPVIIVMDLRNRFSKFLMSSEIVSRRNSMLTLFSKQEQKLIEKSKHMSRAEFSRYLDSINMTRKHSLWLSFVVVVIISITPKTAIASTKLISQKIIKIEKIVYTFDWDIGNNTCMYLEQPPELMMVLKEIKVFFITHITGTLCKGYLRDIGGIPRFKISFS